MRFGRAYRPWTEAGAVFLVAIGFLLALAPTAPFTRELGVCESGAVRDVLAGNIILPRFLPGPIVHVPPLYWWVAALCVKALGWNELALRLPSMVAAALTCAIIFSWTRGLLGRRAALWSTAALLCCHFFLDAARQPRMDSLLALFVTVAAISLERATALRVNHRSLRYFVFAALSIGLGALSKGILGIILPGLAIALFLLVSGGESIAPTEGNANPPLSRRLRNGFAELFRLGLIATFSTGLAIGLAWFAAGYELEGRAFLDWQVRMNLWSRFIPAAAGGADYCVHPFWYFAPLILGGFLPWSMYLPAFAIAGWPRSERQLPRPIVYALCWFTALFIFFSASRGKCSVYILPAFPPLGVLTGWAIAEGLNGLKARRLFAPVFNAGSAAIAVGGTAMVTVAVAIVAHGLPAKMLLGLHPTDRRYVAILVAGGFSPELLIWVIASMMGVAALIFGLLRRIPTWQASGTLAIAVAGGWFWFAVMNPALAERETLKTFAQQVAAAVPADSMIGHFGLGDCELNFYSPSPLVPVRHLSCTQNTAVREYLVIRQRDFDAMAPTRRSCFSTLLQATPDDSIGPRLLIAHIAR